MSLLVVLQEYNNELKKSSAKKLLSSSPISWLGQFWQTPDLFKKEALREKTMQNQRVFNQIQYAQLAGRYRALSSISSLGPISLSASLREPFRLLKKQPRLAFSATVRSVKFHHTDFLRHELTSKEKVVSRHELAASRMVFRRKGLIRNLLTKGDISLMRGYFRRSSALVKITAPSGSYRYRSARDRPKIRGLRMSVRAYKPENVRFYNAHLKKQLTLQYVTQHYYWRRLHWRKLVLIAEEINRKPYALERKLQHVYSQYWRRLISGCSRTSEFRLLPGKWWHFVRGVLRRKGGARRKTWIGTRSGSPILHNSVWARSRAAYLLKRFPDFSFRRCDVSLYSRWFIRRGVCNPVPLVMISERKRSGSFASENFFSYISLEYELLRWRNPGLSRAVNLHRTCVARNCTQSIPFLGMILECLTEKHMCQVFAYSCRKYFLQEVFRYKIQEWKRRPFFYYSKLWARPATVGGLYETAKSIEVTSKLKIIDIKKCLRMLKRLDFGGVYFLYRYKIRYPHRYSNYFILSDIDDNKPECEHASAFAYNIENKEVGKPQILHQISSLARTKWLSRWFFRQYHRKVYLNPKIPRTFVGGLLGSTFTLYSGLFQFTWFRRGQLLRSFFKSHYFNATPLTQRLRHRWFKLPSVVRLSSARLTIENAVQNLIRSSNAVITNFRMYDLIGDLTKNYQEMNLYKNAKFNLDRILRQARLERAGGSRVSERNTDQIPGQLIITSKNYKLFYSIVSPSGGTLATFSSGMFKKQRRKKKVISRKRPGSVRVGKRPQPKKFKSIRKSKNKKSVKNLVKKTARKRKLSSRVPYYRKVAHHVTALVKFLVLHGRGGICGLKIKKKSASRFTGFAKPKFYLKVQKSATITKGPRVASEQKILDESQVMCGFFFKQFLVVIRGGQLYGRVVKFLVLGLLKRINLINRRLRKRGNLGSTFQDNNRRRHHVFFK